MTDKTAILARSITRESSKQTYYIARLMVDKDLVDDFCRAYAYFRWIDDYIDITSQSDNERISFIRNQRDLIDCLFNGEQTNNLSPEEMILVDLIRNDRGETSGLQSFIRNMFAIIEFDAYRKGRLITKSELFWYTDRLGKSVVDGLLYFIGNGHAYPDSKNRYLAGEAAHITHLLRDMGPDTADGFINIPNEYLEEHGISPMDIDTPPFRKWVQSRVEQARENFHLGKQYFDDLDVLRSIIVGYWYSARFETVLDTIERDGFKLRWDYNERRKLSTWLKIAWIGFSATLKFYVNQLTNRF
jgi:phytoene/squalene synthetase